MTLSSSSYLATDVGLWMSLPAFGPALAVVAVVFVVIRRDRRRHPEVPETTENEPPHDGRTEN
ncbi:hypothetical protein MARA_04330 [Mycolicibacterium arabiense]|uniref:Uncharacterized protein n=1 Tax=Mycolicibacterium arabiense TaxID=1286181 RepID=A0A7I7RT81_9MYCO|nr:hypothetical protein MARA_04330 [Mycolicibacterium arabiense]